MTHASLRDRPRAPASQVLESLANPSCALNQIHGMDACSSATETAAARLQSDGVRPRGAPPDIHTAGSPPEESEQGQADSFTVQRLAPRPRCPVEAEHSSACILH